MKIAIASNIGKQREGFVVLMVAIEAVDNDYDLIHYNRIMLCSIRQH
ncbi:MULTISPECIES: hypothetical protein [unclassified Snodgrassella]|nr:MULTISPECIES: hypothetical protein [unclassified Snodgrassella]MCX8752960.1 hypothetical protein [Snodgrassella sp. B3837]